jgi:regulator of replication initiation timing
MSDQNETAAARLWRDRVQIREQERDDARARARIAEDKVAILMAENDQLMAENARLRALLNPDAARARAETEQQMKALKGALMPLLVPSTGTMNS